MTKDSELRGFSSKIIIGRWVLVLVLSVLLCALLPAQSTPSKARDSSQQEASAPPSDRASTTPVFRVRTGLVVVDVVVTDKHGDPVMGLKKEDFIVKEDGKEQTVKSFEAHTQVAQSQVIPKFHLPAYSYTNVPEQKPDACVNIVLFDLLNTPLSEQLFAREQMVQFLKTLPPGQRVALFALGSQLRMISGFTTDSTQLVTAANTLVQHSSALLDSEDEKQRTEDEITVLERSGFAGADSLREFLATEQTFRTDIRVKATLSALNALARGVSGYSGRKNLLWLSEAFPVSLGPDLDSDNPFLNLRSYATLLRETSGLLSSAQVAVYPIDIGGLKTTGGSASSSGVGASGFRHGRSRNVALLNRQSQEIWTAHAAMDDIAGETGGKAFYNANDLKSAMGRSIERGTTYYSLAYTPENRTWDSSYRRIEVKLGQAGLGAEYRKGYFAMPNHSSAEQTDAQRLVAAMQPGMPDSTMLFFGVQVLPLKEGEQTASIAYGINPRDISFNEVPDQRRHGKIELVAVAWDQDNKAAASISQTMNLSLKPETYEESLRRGIQTRLQLQLKPGVYKLRLGVMDDGSGKIGTLEVPFQVPGGQPAKK